MIDVDQLKVFRGRDYKICDGITVRQPTLNEVEAYGEKQYFNLVYFLCSTPADRKVEIWDGLNIFWEEMDEFTLFASSLKLFKFYDLSIIMPGIDLSAFRAKLNVESGDIILEDNDGVIIDRQVYVALTDYLRSVHLMKKNVDVGADDSTRRVMIDLARSDHEAAARKPYESLIVPFAAYLAIHQPFASIWDIPIGAFLQSMGRGQKEKEYDHMMQGIYSGCIDLTKINKKDLNWLGKLK